MDTFLRKLTKRHSLWFMNIAQFGAVVNDNIYKLVMVFMLIELYGTANASSILSKVGAIYVLPFLLFSSAAGILADRHSKKWILSGLKMAEVVIFAVAIFVIKEKSPLGSFLLLFSLAMHSAAFGPSKYSIISELVPEEKVPKANGIITSCTYFGIIVGTFLASFLSEMVDCDYVSVIIFCLALAICGLLSALCITRTPEQGSLRKIHPFFLREIYRTLQSCRQQPHLLLVLCSSAFFLLVGSFTQLNIIPYTLQALHLSEIYGGYLFLCTAMGIATGSLLVGKILKRPIALWVPCIAALGLSLCLFWLFFFPTHVIFVVAFLFCLGVAGGSYVVPLDSFVQLSCTNQMRGQVIAAGNFLGFSGVLISSCLLYFLSNILGLSAMAGFGVMSILCLLYAIFLFFRLSDFTLPFLVKLFYRPLINIELADPKLLNLQASTTLVLYKGSLLQCAWLATIAPHFHFVFIGQPGKLRGFFLRLFYSLDTLEDSKKTSIAVSAAALSLKYRNICFVLPDTKTPSFIPPHFTQVDVIPPLETGDSLHIHFR